ncbi:MAG: hypothetical protein ACRCXT_01975 [Paraclostridium sp.]
MKQFERVLEGILSKEGLGATINSAIEASMENQRMLKETNISGCFWPKGYESDQYLRMLVMKMTLAAAREGNEIIVVGNKHHSFAVNSKKFKDEKIDINQWAHNVIKAIMKNTPANENKEEISEHVFGLQLPEIPKDIQEYPMCAQILFVTEAFKDVISEIESKYGDLNMEYVGEPDPKAPKLIITLKSTESKFNEIKGEIVKHFNDKQK